MKNLLLILGAILVIFAQALLFYRLEIKGVRPDFLFILVFLIVFYRPLERAFFPIWLIGILNDVISQSGMGTTAFLYLVDAIVISFTKQILFREDMITQLAVLFFSAYLCHFFNGLGLYLFYGEPSFWYVFWKCIFISLYTTIVGGIILIAFYKIQWYIQWRATQP